MGFAVIALIITAVVITAAVIVAAVALTIGKNHEADDVADEFPCGKRYDTVQPRFITNGTDATLGSAPWLVSIMLEITEKNGQKIETHNCGGSIISPEWIITATHCIGNINETDKCVKGCKIVAGSMKRNDTGYGYGTRHNVVQQIPFKKDYDLIATDIALLKVSPPFEYRKPGIDGRRAIAPVCLPATQDEDINETEGDIVGFGGTNDTIYHNFRKGQKSKMLKPFREPGIIEILDLFLQPPENLQSAHVSVISRDECVKIPEATLPDEFRNLTDWKEIIFEPKSIICAGILKEHRVPCQGDSGGPLTVDKDGKATLIGVTHIRIANACIVDPIWYGGFTRVSHFRNWITEHTGI